MSLDNAKNFAKCQVSTGYDAAATSIVLTTGHGAKLPSVPFNAVWWNASDYADPSDDANVEVVRVTVIATDTLTITRAQEGTTASTKNTSGRTYKMIAGLTAKAINTDIATVANHAPGADFTITQNSVVPFKSVNAGALVNTLVLSAGKVGVAMSPTYIMDVTGTLRVSTSIGIGGSNPGDTVGGQPTYLAVTGYSGLGGLRVSGADTNNTLYQPAGNLALTTAGGSILITGGKVGIATTLIGDSNVAICTSNANHDYNSSGAAKNIILAYSCADTTVGNDLGVVIRNENTTTNNTCGLHFSSANSDNTLNHIAASIVTVMGARSAGNVYQDGQMVFSTSTGGQAPVEHFRITSGGLGIDAAAPTHAKLQINITGGSSFQSLLAFRSGGDPTFGFDWCVDDAVNGDMKLNRVVSGASTQVMYVARATGYVGIGTAVPTAPLQVAGLPTYAANYIATGAGLTAGAFYTDGSGNVKVVY